MDTKDFEKMKQRQESLIKSDFPGSSKLFLWLMFFYGLGNLLPNMAILTDMDYFIHKYSEIGKHPEFVYNMVINFSFVLGQTVNLFLLISLNLGICLGTLNSIFMGICGLIEPKFIGANLQGCAFSSLVVCFIRWICLMAFDSKVEINYFYSTIMYFAINVLILIVMTLTLKFFLNSTYVKYYLDKRKGVQSTDSQEQTPGQTWESNQEDQINITDDRFNTKVINSELEVTPELKYLSVVKKIWVEASVIFLIFLTTFLLYPSIIFQGNLTLYAEKDWQIFIYNLTYSLGDFMGRSFARIKHQYPRALYVIGCIGRGVFLATTFLIAFNPHNEFWSNSAVIIINTYLIGLTGGFFGVCAGNSFPGKLDNHEKEFGGFVISCMINLGIAIGSLISLVGFQNLFNN
eukprot:403367094